MKNVVLLIVLLSTSIIGFSQPIVADCGGPRYRFGFNLGLSYSNLISPESLPDNASISNGFGYRLGVLMDYKLSDKFLLSPKAEFSLNNSAVKFSNEDGTTSYFDVFPMSLDIMLHAVYRIGDGKVKPYILLGPDFKIPFAKKNSSAAAYDLKPDFAIDIGFGLENNLSFFTLSPELRYSIGLLDVNSNPELKSLYFHNICLVFNFK